jgi:uncharacterized protein involved in outer membrane biogenesis
LARAFDCYIPVEGGATVRGIARTAALAGALLLSALVVLAVLVRRIDLDHYRGRITAAARQATGREVAIDGHLVLRLGWRLRIAADGLRVANAPGGSAADLLRVDHAEAALDWGPLLERRLSIARVSLQGARLSLERHAAGQGNWELPSTGEKSAAPSAEGANAASALGSIDRVDARDVDIRYRDLARGSSHELDLETVSIRAAGPGQPIGLEVAARVDGQPLALSGKLEEVPGGHALDDLRLQVAGTSAEGRIQLLSEGGRPRLVVDGHAAVLDVSPLLSRPSDAAARAPRSPAKRVIPDLPLPLDTLGAGDAALSIAVGRLLLAPSLEAQGVKLEAKVDGGRAHAALGIDALAGGSLHADLRLAPPRAGGVALQASTRGVALGTALSALGLSDLVSDAPTDLDVHLTGRGATLRAVAASLDGDYGVTVGPGTLHDERIDLVAGDLLTDLLNAVNPLLRQGPASELRCAALRGTARGGVLHLDPGVGWRTSKVSAAAAGSIDLDTERIDLAVRADATEGFRLSLGTLASRLVRVRGTLANASIAVDPIGIASAVAQLGARVTGGALSVLEGGLWDSVASGDVCREVATGRPRGGLGDESTRALKGAGEKLERGLQRLLP